MPTPLGKWESGLLKVFAQGIELSFSEPKEEECGTLKSLVLHPNEVGQIPYFLRPAPPIDTRLGYNGKKNLFESDNLFSGAWAKGCSELLHMLRDAFGQAAQAILGAITKDSSFSQVKNSNKRMNEMHAGLTELVPNAWEPILENIGVTPLSSNEKLQRV